MSNLPPQILSVIDGAVTGKDEEEIANLNGDSVKVGNRSRGHLLPAETIFAHML